MQSEMSQGEAAEGCVAAVANDFASVTGISPNTDRNTTRRWPAHASKQDADANIFDNDGNMVGTIFKGKKRKNNKAK